jgi:hypothetical protein
MTELQLLHLSGGYKSILIACANSINSIFSSFKQMICSVKMLMCCSTIAVPFCGRWGPPRWRPWGLHSPAAGPSRTAGKETNIVARLCGFWICVTRQDVEPHCLSSLICYALSIIIYKEIKKNNKNNLQWDYYALSYLTLHWPHSSELPKPLSCWLKWIYFIPGFAWPHSHLSKLSFWVRYRQWALNTGIFKAQNP